MVASGGWWQRAQLRQRLLRTSLLSTTQDRKTRGPWAERGQGGPRKGVYSLGESQQCPYRLRGRHPDWVHPIGTSKKMRVPPIPTRYPPHDISDRMRDPHIHWVLPMGIVEYLEVPPYTLGTAH